MDCNGYFDARNINPSDYANFSLPPYMRDVLRDAWPSSVLDFGCGFGQMMKSLRDLGVERVVGFDIEPAAISYVRALGFDVYDGLNSGIDAIGEAFDLIVMSHVLEHIPKSDIVTLLRKLRELLKPEGALLVMVPNAQSNTGCYWAYEDFTHSTLFTAGSLFYVLKQAGYSSIQLIDKDCLSGHGVLMRLVRRALLAVYDINRKFWNKVTASSYHRPSPVVYSYEIKMLAHK